MVLVELVLPECKGRGSGGEQYKQVVGVPVHCIGLVALERRAVTLKKLELDLTQENVISVALWIHWSTSFCHGLGLQPPPSQAF